MDLYNSLRRSWIDVTPQTIANSFRKAGFVKYEEVGRDVKSAECDLVDDLNQLFAEFKVMELLEGDLENYMAVDEQLAVSGLSTLAEIVADISADVEEPEGECDTKVMEIEEKPEPPVTSRDAAEALKILQRYADTNANPVIMLLCDKVDDLLAKERIKKLKQKNLMSYFKPCL